MSNGARRNSMAKIDVGARTDLYPLPTALVSCDDGFGRCSIITISWTGICNSNPPMLSIAVQKKRYSHDIILQSGKFGLNLPNSDQVSQMDFCGNNSGRDYDKYKTCGFTKVRGDKNDTLLIEECPVSMECAVKHVLGLGTHDLFIAEILSTYIDESVMDDEKRYVVEKLQPIAYLTKAREYRGGFTEKLGKYGQYKDHFKNG
ncbi:MAG: flavin reductase family protein [candidate division Zixibacteria bacterium]|nr:flavin reductase family protein [candidate division Zixibacteria bacterium]